MSQAIALPFTSGTYILLAVARGIAAGRGHADLTGCHVALGLLREGDHAAVEAIGRAGISLPALLHDLESALPVRGHPAYGEVDLPTTPGERAIVDVARSEAGGRHDEYVGAEHLLLALLRDSESAAARVFLRHGLTYETAVEQLASVLGGQPIESGVMPLGAFSVSLAVDQHV